MTNLEIIGKVYNVNNGYVTRREINSLNISSIFLSQYVRKKWTGKLGTGFMPTKMAKTRLFALSISISKICLFIL